METPRRLLHERFMPRNAPFRLFKHVVDEHVPLHWHEFFEIAFVTEGAGSHFVNGRVVPLGKGSMYLLTPADLHAVTPTPGRTLRLYNAIFVQQFLRAELYQWLFEHGEGFVVDVAEEHFGLFESGFARMWEETEQPRPGSEWILSGTLERVLVDWLRLYGRDRQQIGEPADKVFHPSIGRALTYVQFHFREPLTLVAVARHAGLSANYFSECFHKQVGMSFQSYLQDVRLQFAHSLLAMTPLPITEVCYTSGFGNLSHFDRSFKSKYGRTPRQSRQAAASRRPSG